MLTDGVSLIFYPVLQKIKLKLDEMLPLQFKRGEKKKEIKTLLKGSPYGRKEWAKTLSGFAQKTTNSRTVSKRFFSLPFFAISKIYDLSARSRPSLKAIMNYISRDIITQEA